MPPADYRVAEVRLLHDVEEVGETRAERNRAEDNLLISGDALNALTSLCEAPRIRPRVRRQGVARLPRPFNTQQAFAHYDDALEHSVWLTMMRDRLPVRVGRAKRSHDRSGKFERGVGYEGWERSMYVQAWFVSSTERTLATILDDAEEIRYWVQLLVGDLPILWQSDGRDYNPDFVAVDADRTHWLVESKMDKELEGWDVRGKENAALRWANHVSAKTAVTWRYLLVSETDIATARGSWLALRKLERS